jgi:hypothetical protein
MGLKDELFAIEEGFWTGGEDYFRAHLDDDCLVAFPHMAGGYSFDEVPAAANDQRRWKDLETGGKDFLHPVEDLALLAYEARAVRGNGEPYHALINTGYVRRGDGWKMAFHSRTPLAGDGRG